MSGDWIKMRKSLAGDPRVVRMMSALKADRFRTIGGLFSAWCLLDEQTEDGLLENYTPQIFDDFVGFQGLANAMILVGWLAESPQGLVAVNFTEHNGQTAKRRAQDSVRKMSAREADKTRTKSGQNADQRREEKRREEKINDTSKDVSNTKTSLGFGEWYSLYPRKVAKGEAVKAYGRALKRIGGDPAEAAAKLLEASKPRLLEIAKRDPQYQPNPATWLNGDGWQDEVKAINPTKPTGAGPGVNYDPAFDDQFMADLYTG
jgi:hypothetical protein